MNFRPSRKDDRTSIQHKKTAHAVLSTALGLAYACIVVMNSQELLWLPREIHKDSNGWKYFCCISSSAALPTHPPLPLSICDCHQCQATPLSRPCLQFTLPSNGWPQISCSVLLVATLAVDCAGDGQRDMMFTVICPKYLSFASHVVLNNLHL